MSMVKNLPILVGVDGSEASLTAARFAAHEAKLRDRPVLLAHAYSVPALATPMMVPPYDWLPEALEEEAHKVLDGAAKVIRAEQPAVQVATEAAAGPASQLLIEMSDNAELVVVGHRGRGGFTTLLLGSVASKVAAHAHVPVLVVRPAANSTGATAPIVVGIDGSEVADAALGFAFEEAQRRGRPLHAVHVWQPPTPPHRADVRYDPAELETAERHRLSEWVAPWREKYPQVPVQNVLVAGDPVSKLIDVGREAELLVVGSRGRGGFSGLLLGSVSHQLVIHATATLAVVR